MEQSPSGERPDPRGRRVLDGLYLAYLLAGPTTTPTL
jgi:hypothetical protein